MQTYIIWIKEWINKERMNENENEKNEEGTERRKDEWKWKET